MNRPLNHKTTLFIIALAVLSFLFLFREQLSPQTTAAQSAYPGPNSTGQLPTPQLNSALSAYPAPSTPNVPIVSPTAAPVQPDNTALIMDAKAYASAMGVDLKEAVRRLQLQDTIDELNGRLTAGEADTFGGLWIQHKPDYRIIVMFTQNGDATVRPYIQNGPLAGLVTVTTARATLKNLEATHAEAAQVASKSGVPSSSAINISKNQAELYVEEPTSLTNGLLKANAQLPANVEVVKSKLPRNVAEIGGGKSLPDCTSGFSVVNPSGIKGITTAGHCNDTQSYGGVNLPFMSGTTGGVYDIQWNRADQAFTVRNWVWDGTSNRAIYNVRFRASQSVGDWICKYGKTTGFGCGTIATTSQDGVNIRLDDVSVDFGDSGGPWFVNTTAYGTTISKMGTSSIYGPVDHIGVVA